MKNIDISRKAEIQGASAAEAQVVGKSDVKDLRNAAIARGTHIIDARLKSPSDEADMLETREKKREKIFKEIGAIYSDIFRDFKASGDATEGSLMRIAQTTMASRLTKDLLTRIQDNFLSPNDGHTIFDSPPLPTPFNKNMLRLIIRKIDGTVSYNVYFMLLQV